MYIESLPESKFKMPMINNAINILFLLGITNLSYSQTEIKKTTFKNGQTELLYTYVNGILNGPYKAFHENGKKWSEGNYTNGNLEGTFIVYAENEDTASIEIYHAGQLWTKKVFYQEYPDYSYKPISKKGFICVKDGKSITLDRNTPDGFLERDFDTITSIMKDYIWENGKRKEIELSKPDGVIETILMGEKPGVYEWKNKKKVFVRPLTEEDKKGPDDPELLKMLMQMQEQLNDTIKK